MNKNESKYFNTAIKMDRAFLEILDRKEFSYITVKEICEKAGVNRSTFYLHYETIEDLLCESVEYLNEQFSSFMNQDVENFSKRVESDSAAELYLITPEYLIPYLEYIKAHNRLFLTAIKNTKTLRLDNIYDKMFRLVFVPILDKYNVPVEQRHYIMAFYIQGIMAIISEWLKDDCKEDVEYIMGIIQQCVQRPAYDVLP